MKKLSLKNLNLDASDLLQRNQLKTVVGGYGDEFPECANSAFMAGVQAEAAGYSQEEAEWFVQCAYAVECYGYSPSDCN